MDLLVNPDPDRLDDRRQRSHLPSRSWPFGLLSGTPGSAGRTPGGKDRNDRQQVPHGYRNRVNVYLLFFNLLVQGPGVRHSGGVQYARSLTRAFRESRI
jgi:hypothetical protein